MFALTVIAIGKTLYTTLISIVICVYNTYHFFNLYITFEYLRSEQCKSFAQYEQYRYQSGGALSKFCSMLSDNLRLPCGKAGFTAEIGVRVTCGQIYNKCESFVLVGTSKRKQASTNMEFQNFLINCKVDASSVVKTTTKKISKKPMIETDAKDLKQLFTVLLLGKPMRHKKD
jgi:hypothetical protein